MNWNLQNIVHFSMSWWFFWLISTWNVHYDLMYSSTPDRVTEGRGEWHPLFLRSFWEAALFFFPTNMLYQLFLFPDFPPQLPRLVWIFENSIWKQWLAAGGPAFCRLWLHRVCTKVKTTSFFQQVLGRERNEFTLLYSNVFHSFSKISSQLEVTS